MKKSSHPFRKKWGQNFLNDQNLLNKIVDVINPKLKDSFLEIGAGDGVLTEKIFPKIKEMATVEIDPLLIEKLSLNQNLKDLIILDGDILSYDIDQINIAKPVKIIGNIPYNITSSIIFWLIEQLDYWDEAFIMMQKEVAERLVAKTGTKAYGRLTVVTSAYLNKEICFNISPEVFYPKPKVYSALVKFSKKSSPIVSDNEFIKYNKLVRTAFSMRRKMIKNTLSGYCFSNDVKNEIDFSRRPETLSPEEFAALLKSIQ